MRKGIQGLSGLVRESFGADPTDGSLFVFINRRRDRRKILERVTKPAGAVPDLGPGACNRWFCASLL